MEPLALPPPEVEGDGTAMGGRQLGQVRADRTGARRSLQTLELQKARARN